MTHRRAHMAFWPFVLVLLAELLVGVWAAW